MRCRGFDHGVCETGSAAARTAGAVAKCNYKMKKSMAESNVSQINLILLHL
jgi:hypothetical protein